MSDSVWPHRWQPTGLPHPWDSPGKNTGVGCHFLLQCVKSESEVAQSCPTLSDPMDCSPPGSSIHGIFQARVLEWGAIAFSIALTIWTFVSKVMSLLFNTLSRFVIAFLPRNNYLLISWLQSPSALTLEPKKRKSVTAFTFSLSVCHEVMGPDAMLLVFGMLHFKTTFSFSSFTLIKKLFSSSLPSAIRVISSAYHLRLLIFLPVILISAYNSFSPTFPMMCSMYKLNNQGDNKKPCYTPFLILNLSVVSYSFLTIAS